MRARSRMAALALVVGTSFAVGRAMPALVANQTSDKGQATETEKFKSPPADQGAKSPRTTIASIELNLVIAGLGTDGCDVEIKPGNASCKFRPVYGKSGERSQHVSKDGYAKLALRDVELRGADRTCAVAITVREPNQTAKTFYRGFRLPNAKEEAAATAKPASGTAFTCYLRAPSKLAKSDESRIRK
jgi:hypothetical protein